MNSSQASAAADPLPSDTALHPTRTEASSRI